MVEASRFKYIKLNVNDSDKFNKKLQKQEKDDFRWYDDGEDEEDEEEHIRWKGALWIGAGMSGLPPDCPVNFEWKSGHNSEKGWCSLISISYHIQLS